MRETARHAIEAGGCVPVLVNEDFPSLAASSRNACLDAIGSCDALALIVGSRGGWVTPSGRLVVEEEYHHARSLGLPVVVLLADTERDAEATRFVSELSDYVDGHFRTTYRDMPELAQQLERSVGTLTQTLELPMTDMTKVLSIAAEEPAISDECSLRVVVVPERDEELIDPAKLQSSEFLDALYGIGHDRGVGLLDYERPKTRIVISFFPLSEHHRRQEPFGEERRHGYPLRDALTPPVRPRQDSEPQPRALVGGLCR